MRFTQCAAHGVQNNLGCCSSKIAPAALKDPYVEAALQAPPSLNYVPGPEEPEQAPLSPDYVPGPEYADDEIVAEDQSGAEDAPPTAQSPDYVPDTDPKADPEEDDDEDPEEGSYRLSADEDDEIDVEVDEEVEEEHSAPAYPVVVALPTTAPSAEETEPLRLMRLRHTTTYLCISTSHSLSLPLPFILSPTRPDAPPPMPTSAPTSLPPLLLPFASHGEDRPEVNLPPREREIRRDPERYVGYGITDSWDEIVETLQGAPVSTDTKLGAHVRDFESMVRRYTDEIYTILDDEQSQRQLLASRAWGRSMDASDLARAEIMSLRTTVHAQMSEITELQSADRSRRRAISDLLETDCGRHEEMRELRAADPLQGQVMALQGQVTALQGQQGPARGLAQPELPEEAGSSS
ncbi:hypothetical protein Tco_0567798 [Tanacetum coccineum]